MSFTSFSDSQIQEFIDYVKSNLPHEGRFLGDVVEGSLEEELARRLKILRGSKFETLFRDLEPIVDGTSIVYYNAEKDDMEEYNELPNEPYDAVLSARLLLFWVERAVARKTNDAEIEKKRAAALSKLTVEERQILGLN